jgi:hypothetical protein
MSGDGGWNEDALIHVVGSDRRRVEYHLRGSASRGCEFGFAVGPTRRKIFTAADALHLAGDSGRSRGDGLFSERSERAGTQKRSLSTACRTRPPGRLDGGCRERAATETRLLELKWLSIEEGQDLL